MNALCAIDNGLLSSSGLLTPEPPTNLKVSYSITIPLDSDPNLILHYPFNQNILNYGSSTSLSTNLGPNSGVADATVSIPSNTFLSSPTSIYQNGMSAYSYGLNLLYFYTFNPIDLVGNTLQNKQNGAYDLTIDSGVTIDGTLNSSFNGSVMTTRFFLSSTYSIGCWFYAQVYSQQRIFAFSNDDTLNNCISFYYDGVGSNDFFYVRDGTPVNANGGDNKLAGAFRIRIWYHIVYVNSGSTWYVYINGNLNTTFTDKGSTYTQEKKYNTIGKGVTSSPSNVNGRITGFFVYNSTLSIEQIQDIYSKGRNPTPTDYGFPIQYNPYLSINTIPTNTGGYSFSFWVYLNSTTGLVFSFANALNSVIQIYCRFNSGQLVFYCNNTSYTTTGLNFSLYTWYHISWTLSTSNQTNIYVNGNFVATTTSITYSSFAFNYNWISADTAYNNIGLNGYINDFRYYNRILDSAEVFQLYNIYSLNFNSGLQWQAFYGKQTLTTADYTYLFSTTGPFNSFQYNAYYSGGNNNTLFSTSSNLLTTISYTDNIAVANNIFGFTSGSPVANAGINIGLLVYGYFRPDISGIWNLKLDIDNIGVLWFNDGSGGNSSWPPTDTNYSLSITSVTNAVYTTTSLIAGTYYPFQITWSQAAGNSKLIFSFKKTTSATYITDGTGYFFSNIVNNNTDLNSNELVLYYPFDTDFLNYASGTGVTFGTVTTPIGPVISNSVYNIGTGSLSQPNYNDSTWFKIPAMPANTGGYSFSMWVYFLDSNQGFIFSFSQYGKVAGYETIRIYFYNDGNSLIFFCNNKSFDIGALPTLNTWTHYAWTLDINNINRFYINGKLRFSNTNINYASFDLNLNYIFSDGYGSTRGQRGYLDDFRYYNRVLNQSEVSALYNIENTLLLYYPFDEDYLNYASGTGVDDATITGTTVARNTDNYIVGSGSLYQSTINNTSYFVAPDLSANTGGYSFALWLNMTSTSSGMIFAFAEKLSAVTDVSRISFWNNGTQMRFLCSNAVAGLLFSQPPLNTWTHYVWTLDTGSNTCIYVNGSMLSGYPKVDSNNKYASFPMNNNLILGDNYNIIGPGQQGYVDDFRYYNRILTQSEVSKLYNMFIPSYPTTSYSLVLYYPFNRDISNYASGIPTTNGSIVGSTVSISRTKYATGNGSLYQSASNSTSYFSIPALAANTGGYTFALWLNITSYTFNGMIFAFANATGTDFNRISFWNKVETGVLRLLCSNTGSEINISRPPLNTWNHYAWTLDTASNNCVYVNGRLSSYSGSTPYASFAMNYNYILGDTNSGSLGQQGYVDDFQYYNKVLTQAEIIALYDTYNPSDVSANSLILYYPFNKDLLNYASGTGVTFGSKTGSGIDLNYSNYAVGTGSLYKSVSENTSYFSPDALPPNTGGYTFALWVYFTNITTTGTLFSFANASNSTTRIYLSSTSSNITIFCNNNSITNLTAPSQNNIWYHYTWTLDTNSNSNFYINGVLQSGFPSQTIPYANFPMSVNRIYGDTTGGNSGPGYIDDFRYYNTILSQAQVTELYNMKTDIPNTGTLSLKLYYPFDTDISNYASGVGVTDGTINGSNFSINTKNAVGTGSLYHSVYDNTSYFSTTSLAGTTNTNGYSFSFWIYLTSIANVSAFFSFSAGTTTDRVIMRCAATSNPNIFIFTSAGDSLDTKITPVINTWYHIVWTNSGTTPDANGITNVYLNGIIKVNNNTTLLYRRYVMNKFYIFGDTYNTTNSTQGYIDDFRYYDGILSQAQVTDLYNSKQPYSLTLKLYYPFDTDISNYASGTGVTNGSITGTNVSLNKSNPIVGLGCLYQSATSNNTSYLTIPTIDTNVYGYSFSFWFYFTSTTAGMLFSFASAQNSASRIFIYNTTTNLRFSCNNNNNDIGSIYPKLNTWYHYVWTLDANSNTLIYINGVLQVTATTPTYANFAMTYNRILGDTNTTYGGQQGYIDDFRYYDGILNQNQVTDLYNMKGLFQLKDLINTLSLLLYYPFDIDIKNYASGVAGAVGTISGGTVSLSNTNYAVGTGSLYHSAIDINNFFKCDSLAANINGYSFSLWVYYINNTTNGIIISFANALNSDTNRVYIFNISTTVLRLACNAVVYDFSANSFNNLNTWYHYVWTLDKSNRSCFYVNGVLQANFTSVLYVSFAMNYNYILGSTFTTAANYGAQAYVDDFRYYDGILSPTQVTDIYNSKNTQNFTPNTDAALCIYYPFDISRSYIVNYAASVYGTVDASYVNGAVVDYTTNNVGTGALKLVSASSQYVILNSNNIVQTTNFISPNGMTFSLWIKSNSTAANAAIFYIANSSTDYLGLFINGSNSISCKDYNSSGENSTVALSTNYNNNIWRHVVWTLGYSSSNTSRWNIYIDGIMVSDTSSNYYPKSTTAKITSRLGNDNGSIYYTGWIDDFRVYQRVLNQLEVTQLYNYRDICGNFTLNSNSAIFSWTPPARNNGVSYNYYYTDNTLNSASGLQWKAFYGVIDDNNTILYYNGNYNTNFYTFQNISRYSNGANTLSSTSANVLTNISYNNIASSGNVFGFSNAYAGGNYGYYISLVIIGYFLPNQTGSWSFQFGIGNNRNDDMSVFWIDDGANVNGTTTHWPPNDTNYNFLNSYITPIASTIYTTTLTAGVYYPIQLNWGQSGGGSCLGFYFQPPGGSYTSDGTGYFFYSTTAFSNPVNTKATNVVIPEINTNDSNTYYVNSQRGNKQSAYVGVYDYYPSLQWKAFYGATDDYASIAGSITANSFQTYSRYSGGAYTSSSTSSNLLNNINFNYTDNTIAANGNPFGFTSGIFISLIITGYFKPDQTGTWNFKFIDSSFFTNDDFSIFWIDDGANVNGTTFHWPPTDSNYNKFSTSTPYTTTLTAGVYYPIQLTWSQSAGGSVLGFCYKGPNMASYTYDGTGYFFYSFYSN